MNGAGKGWTFCTLCIYATAMAWKLGRVEQIEEFEDGVCRSEQGSGKTSSEYPEMLEQDQEVELDESASEKLILERQISVNGSPIIPDKTPATDIFVPVIFFRVMWLIIGNAAGSKWSSGWLDQSPVKAMATVTSSIWTSEIMVSLI